MKREIVDYTTVDITTLMPERLLTEITNWVWDNVVAKDVIPPQMPSEVSEILNNLNQELQKIKRNNDELDDYFCFLPNKKFISGSPLKEDEFHLLSAIGILMTDSYKNFMYWFYEDETITGYINPKEPLPEPPPREGEKVRATYRLGNEIKPEEVRVSCLRDDQREFFKENLPELFARFKNK